MIERLTVRRATSSMPKALHALSRSSDTRRPRRRCPRDFDIYSAGPGVRSWSADVSGDVVRLVAATTGDALLSRFGPFCYPRER